MPEGTDKIDPPLSREERKQRIILACIADRAAWCQACEPGPQEPLARVGQLLKMLEPLTFLLPGRLGRWIRKAEFLTHLGRQFSGLFAH